MFTSCIPSVGLLDALPHDENTLQTGIDRDGGVQHVELTLVPEQPAPWAEVEEEDTFDRGHPEGRGITAGLPITRDRRASLPVPLRAGLLKASIEMRACISYHTSDGVVSIFLDFTKPIRISQELVSQLAANLNWEEAAAVTRRPK